MLVIGDPSIRKRTVKFDLKFKIQAAAIPEADYQWFLNDWAVKGATNKVLHINSVNSNDAGRYSVEISNSSGTATSREVELIVK